MNNVCKRCGEAVCGALDTVYDGYCGEVQKSRLVLELKCRDRAIEKLSAQLDVLEKRLASHSHGYVSPPVFGPTRPSFGPRFKNQPLSGEPLREAILATQALIPSLSAEEAEELVHSLRKEPKGETP